MFYHNICPINVYVCARFHEIPAKGLQDIKERKCYGRTDGHTDGWTDKLKTVYPPYNFIIAGGCKKTFLMVKSNFHGALICLSYIYG